MNVVIKQNIIYFSICLLCCFACTNQNDKLLIIQPFNVSNSSLLSLDLELKDAIVCKNVVVNSDTFRNEFYSENISKFLSKKLINYCKSYNYIKIKEGLQQLTNLNNDTVEYKSRTILHRTIVKEFEEEIIHIIRENVLNKEPLHLFSYNFYLKIIKKGDDIVQFQIEEVSRININSVWSDNIEVVGELNNQNEELISELKIEYSSVYKTPILFDELFKTDIVFGSYCGSTGGEPEYRLKMNDLVKNKDTTILIQWLRSATVEFQLYAIYGILELQNQGIIFDKEIFYLIDIIENKDGDAYTCSGCTHWNQSIKEVIARIKKEHNTP